MHLGPFQFNDARKKIEFSYLANFSFSLNVSITSLYLLNLTRDHVDGLSYRLNGLI